MSRKKTIFGILFLLIAVISNIVIMKYLDIEISERMLFQQIFKMFFCLLVDTILFVVFRKLKNIYYLIIEF